MTEERLDLLLDLAMEQYDPAPGKQELAQAKFLGKVSLHSPEQQRIDRLFKESFAMFASLMQTI